MGMPGGRAGVYVLNPAGWVVFLWMEHSALLSAARATVKSKQLLSIHYLGQPKGWVPFCLAELL